MLTSHYPNGGWVHVEAGAWNDLSGDDQDSLQEAFDTAREQSVPEIETREEQSLEEITDNESLMFVANSDIPAFREAVAPVFESYLGEQSVISPDEFRDLAP